MIVISERAPLILFGAGSLGRRIAAGLRRLGRTPVAIVDETPGKAGDVLEGLPVTTLESALTTAGSDPVVIVTIWNPAHSFVATAAVLRARGVRCVASWLHLAHGYPQAFLPHFAFDGGAAERRAGEAPARALAALSDEESRRQWRAHMQFRQSLNFDALPPASAERYFRTEFGGTREADVVFLDGGAFQGDTVSEFVAASGGAFRRVVAVEADADNYGRLRQVIGDLGVSHRTDTCHAALSDTTGRASFEPAAIDASRLSEAGSATVDTITVDDLLPDASGNLFLKLDVEGAERAALMGAAATWRRSRVFAAVSAYHRPEDLWELPLLLHSRGCQVYLRTEGPDGMGIVCYGVPR